MPEKKAFEWEIESLLKSYDEEIAKVKVRASAPNAPDRVHRLLDELLLQRTELQQRFDVLKHASQADWKSLKLGVEDARQKLTMNLAKALMEFEDERGQA